MKKSKILFVIQRYGENVAGGAEWFSRQVAEHLVDKYEVEVATTMALDYSTWKNEDLLEEEKLNGVLIRRFKNDQERAKTHSDSETDLRQDINNIGKNIKWIIEQGPISTDLVNFVKTNQDSYKKIIVVQYLYAINYFVIKSVKAEKLVLVPLAHEEPQIEYPIFREVFRKPSKLVFNMGVERAVVERIHHIKDKVTHFASVGINSPNFEKVVPKNFQKKFNVENYVMFMGRIDKAKRVDVLINDFIHYKNNNKSDLKLVLVGKVLMDIPKHDDIITTGFVSEQEKYEALKGAMALVNPSPYESLSMIVLESFLMKRPVIVNEESDVLKHHCLKANGGLWYRNEHEFESIVNYYLKNPKIASQMGANGYKYAKSKYSWETAIENWINVIEN